MTKITVNGKLKCPTSRDFKMSYPAIKLFGRRGPDHLSPGMVGRRDMSLA